MAKTLLRFVQVRKPDNANDNHSALGISHALADSTTQEDFQRFVLSQIKRLIYGATAGHWNDDFVAAGIPSLLDLAHSTEDVTVMAFDYTSPGSQILQNISAGNLLSEAIVLISDSFDGANASLNLGTAAQPELIFGSADVLLKTTGQYENTQLFRFTVGDVLRLTLASAGSTKGAGLLLYKLKG